MNKGKDDIEKLLLNNLDHFNDSEPPEGHFDRFEAKLKQQSKKGSLNLRMIWRVAAAVIFVFLTVNQAVIYFAPESEISSLGAISQEYSEVEYYYTSSINAGLNQWESFGNAGLLTENDKVMMDNELGEFEEVLKGLQEELKANPNDERVINAMLEIYQSKLNVINLIVTKLQEVKTQNETSHEIEI